METVSLDGSNTRAEGISNLYCKLVIKVNAFYGFNFDFYDIYA